MTTLKYIISEVGALLQKSETARLALCALVFFVIGALVF
jgi:hypothetical protein